MAVVGEAEIRLSVKGGNLPPILKAFGVMGAALAAYGHEFSAEDQATIEQAAELLGDPDAECVVPSAPVTHEGCLHA